MVFGDGDRAPTGGETALLNEVHRETLSGQGLVEGQTAAFFEAYLGPNIGGFVIREHGLLTADGTLVAVGVRNHGIPKADPATGASDDFTYRLDIFFEHLDVLVVQVDPIHGITSDNLQLEISNSDLACVTATSFAKLTIQQTRQELRLRVLEGAATANMETAL